MKNTFLSLIIDRILSDGQVPLHDVAVILPNRRAQRYLLQGLLLRNGEKPMFSPHIFPMEEFVAWLSPLKSIDPVTQLMRLHTLTRDFPGERFELHRLLSWGTAFLKDISDMDMQLQDVPAIFRESANAARFEIPFGKEELSETDREKLMFNDMLADMYIQYRKLLLDNKEAYEGMLYRDCVENMERYTAEMPFKRLIFAGFYALSPSELRIIRYLKEHFLTEVYFDVDPFYCRFEDGTMTSSGQREPSFFIQRDCKQLKIDPSEMEFSEKNYASIPKEIQIVATSKNMRQIYCAIQEVERIKNQKLKENPDIGEIVDMSDTAVVLADEDMLFPFLASYQPDRVRVNATMGFPFRATPVFSLLQQLIAVYESVFALTSDDAGELSFSGEQIRRLWKHELLATAEGLPDYFSTVIPYSQLPHKEEFVNCTKQEVGCRLPEILKQFCQYATSLTNVEVYRKLWREVDRKLAESQEVFKQCFRDGEIVDFTFSKYAVIKVLGDVSISMKGDPDLGLQVMGLLETRMMDFENIIMLSVNEGILPKGITYNSLLPFDFKFKFDGEEALPNYLYQDQVYAYHFFRLLQRAKNITLIYNNASDVNMAEKSRFIAQLEYEVRAQLLENTIKITQKNLDFDLELPVRMPLSVPKTTDVLNKLRNYAFSASSLQTYISCPIRFYFQHLMKIREPVILTDNLEVYEMGTVIHGVFKLAFDEISTLSDPLQYVSVLQKYIDDCSTHIFNEIHKLQGREKLTPQDLDRGAWKVNLQIINETVRQYLEAAKQELASSPWRIEANEMPVDIRDYPVVPPNGNPAFPVKLRGSLDRVQRDGDTVMILDYKTGVVEPGELKITVSQKNAEDQTAVDAAFDALFTDPKYAKLFQLVMYALMYDHLNGGQISDVRVGILSTRKVNKKSDNYILQGSILKESNIMVQKKRLQDSLNRLFCEIFDSKTPFLQTDNEKNCRNCDFLHICGRQTTVDSRM